MLCEDWGERINFRGVFLEKKYRPTHLQTPGCSNIFPQKIVQVWTWANWCSNCGIILIEPINGVMRWKYVHIHVANASCILSTAPSPQATYSIGGKGVLWIPREINTNAATDLGAQLVWFHRVILIPIWLRLNRCVGCAIDQTKLDALRFMIVRTLGTVQSQGQTLNYEQGCPRHVSIRSCSTDLLDHSASRSLSLIPTSVGGFPTRRIRDLSQASHDHDSHFHFLRRSKASRDLS